MLCGSGNDEEKKAKTTLSADAALKKFGKVVEKKSFKGQAIFFLNAMWHEHSDEAEKFYALRLLFEEIAGDTNKASDGMHDLNDVGAARVFERMKETMTAIERRNKFRDIDIDGNNRMGLLEYAVYKYKVDVKTLMNRPQGTNEAVKKAQKALRVVLNEISKIEADKATFNKIIAEKTGVKAIRAKASLAQLLSADRLPFNRAKITAEAAVRKAEKSKDVSCQGQIWWLKREMREAKSYKAKGGIDKSRFSVSQ